MTALKDKEINELQLGYNVLSFNGQNCINDLVKIDSVKDKCLMRHWTVMLASSLNLPHQL
jgi:hypothetical protein